VNFPLVFVNLYYGKSLMYPDHDHFLTGYSLSEFNNPGLDAGSSNLKCAAYSDTHTAAEKTNTGGQNLGYGDDHLTFIQQSTGWSKKTLVDPTTPDGYDLVFGPVDGANNAPGVSSPMCGV
jgi:hypothetical protein